MPIPFFSRESPTLASANWSVIVSQEALIMEWYIVATKLTFLAGVFCRPRVRSTGSIYEAEGRDGHLLYTTSLI